MKSSYLTVKDSVFYFNEGILVTTLLVDFEKRSYDRGNIYLNTKRKS